MQETLREIAKLIRYFILVSTTEAGSGHPSSSLSAVELMTVLLFASFFKFDPRKIDYPNNDRLIFSKGHAAPLFYSLYGAAGLISEEELLTLRKFNSRLEGHPTSTFPFTETSTGSLGQGLGIGLGMALNAKYIDKSSSRIYVLLGDSEMAEGSVWEAIQIAAYYKLDNLVGIIDVNRLGQRGETMYGHNLSEYEKRISAFGWDTVLVDGHDINQIQKAYEEVLKSKNPVMIIAKTIKGKGVSIFENADNWHGKALGPQELEKALDELGRVDKAIRGELTKPPNVKINYPPSVEQKSKVKIANKNLKVNYKLGEMMATRKAYGNALVRIFPKFPDMVVLDSEVGNSTYSEIFKERYPERFFEMFIAEQNMVSAALGLSKRGKIPFISTFAAFFTRGFDQIRMSQYCDSNIKFVGSHSGVSIGEDGPSQMGLEDIAMFRTLINSVVLYPCDGVSTEKLVEEAAKHKGNVYVRTTRKETPVIYSDKEKFEIGGSKVHRIKPPKASLAFSGNQSASRRTRIKKKIGIVAAGITLHEALKAQEELIKEGIEAVVLDLYSIKPIDQKTLKKLAKETKALITVEDHYKEGGLGEAVASLLSNEKVEVHILAVSKIPKSGKPEELLKYEEIDAEAIIKKAKEVVNNEAA